MQLKNVVKNYKPCSYACNVGIIMYIIDYNKTHANCLCFCNRRSIIKLLRLETSVSKATMTGGVPTNLTVYLPVENEEDMLRITTLGGIVVFDISKANAVYNNSGNPLSAGSNLLPLCPKDLGY